MSDLIRVKVPDLADFSELEITKVYVYNCPGVGQSFNMISENTTSFVALSQAIFNAENRQHKMKQDEVGNWYCEVVAAQTDTETFRRTSQTSSLAETLYRAKQFSMLSNNFPVYYDDRTFVCSIDKPLVFDPITKQNTTDTPIYIVSSNNTTVDVNENWYMVEQDLLPQETYNEFNVLDMSVVQEKYVNCTIKFYKNDSGVLGSPTNTNNNNGITITTSNNGLFANNFLTIIANEDRLETRMDFVIDSLTKPLFPFKAYDKFIDDDALELYMDWFDKSLYLPWQVASLFLGSGSSIDKAFGTITPNTAESSAINLIYDMLGWSYLAYINFEPEGAPTTWRTDANITTGGLGQIQPQWSFGIEFKRNVLQASAQNPTIVIDGMFDQWIGKWPTADIGLKRLVKSIIGALSRYLASKYAFAGGMNDALISLVPWWLVPAKLGLKLTESTNPKVSSVILDNTDLLFILNSMYFDFTNNLPNINSAVISEGQVIELNGEQTQFVKKLPNMIAPENRVENKDQLPSAMLTDGNEAMEYLWYVALNSPADFAKLVQGDTSSGQKTITFTNISTIDWPFINGILTSANQNDYLTAYFQRTYGSNITLNFTSEGDIQSQDVGQGLVKGDWNELDDSNLPVWLRDMPDLAGAYARGNFTTEQLQYIVVKFYNLTTNEANIKILATRSNFISEIQGVNETDVSLDFDYTTTQYYCSEVSGTLTYTTNLFKNNKLIFNKAEWKTFLKNSGISLTGNTTISIKWADQSSIINHIREIVFGGVWFDHIDLYFSGNNIGYIFPVDCINRNDETIVLQSIIFT